MRLRAPVAARRHEAFDLDELAVRARELGCKARKLSDDWPRAGLSLAAEVGRQAPWPGEGSTLGLWEILANLGAADLAVARAVEPHLDALAILHQAGRPRPEEGTTWGVFAAEGKDARLEARETADGWRLDGVKPWCSLAAEVSHAVVTAYTGASNRRAFAVRLQAPGVTSESSEWSPHGLRGIVSTPVRFDDVPAVPVGDDGWYLERAGFAWGGMGVAAVWYGGALGVARRLWSGYTSREPDQIGLMQLGAADLALGAARAVLAEAADDVDAGRAEADCGALLALRVRGVVADAVEQVLRTVDHALGPAPLAFDAEHAQRVADLRLYVRQHHAERDAATLGRSLLAAGTMPW
ncbi:hypothetical protein LK10_20135 [Sinomonas humi]|uniref:Uncharacterized protein n=1 Tax=Sinomonas humi TaxID=1338436 RepID=A0A0B2AFC5_9MICC|nr:hypothetical protein LK10_20135 [Sinomonas humi]